MIRNNQRRRRGGGNNGPRPQQMTGGNNYGNRLDNRQRGNATQLLEKYRALARDAQQAGDRVTAEYYLQYAEHYFRVLGDYRDRQPEQQRRGREGFDEELLDDQAADADVGYGDEEAEESRENDRREFRQPRDDRRPREDRPRDDRRREDRPREERAREARPLDDRARDERSREDRARDGRRNAGEQRRDGEPRREERPERRPERSPATVMSGEEGGIPGLPGPATLRMVRRSEEASAAATVTAEPAPMPEDVAELPAPRRRGRPRKAVAEVTAEN